VREAHWKAIMRDRCCLCGSKHECRKKNFLCVVWKIRSYAKFFILFVMILVFARIDVYVTDTHTHILLFLAEWRLSVTSNFFHTSFSFPVLFSYANYCYSSHRNFFSFHSVSIGIRRRSQANFERYLCFFKFKWIRWIKLEEVCKEKYIQNDDDDEEEEPDSAIVSVRCE